MEEAKPGNRGETGGVVAPSSRWRRPTWKRQTWAELGRRAPPCRGGSGQRVCVYRARLCRRKLGRAPAEKAPRWCLYSAFKIAPIKWRHNKLKPTAGVPQRRSCCRKGLADKWEGPRRCPPSSLSLSEHPIGCHDVVARCLPLVSILEKHSQDSRKQHI